MRSPLLAFVLASTAAPLSAQTSVVVRGANVTASATPTAGATWSGRTPVCRLDRCGPNEMRACLLRFCVPDSARADVLHGGTTVLPDTVWRFIPLGSARPDSMRRPAPAQRLPR